MTKKKTLLIYGALGAHEVKKHISDWSTVVAVEMDAYLPPEAVQQGAQILPSPPLMDHARAAEVERRVNAVIGEFLQDRAAEPGLDTGRDFRAAGISVESFMLLSPYVYSLDLARRLAASGPWEKIVVSPGGGVSVPAWRQLAESCGVPLILLTDAGLKPPFWWMLKRRWQKKTASRSHKKAAAARPAPLPVADANSPWISGDPRLDSLLSYGSTPWARVPAWSAPSESELTAMRARYLSWWERWWKAWLADHPSEEPLSENWIIQELGRHLCQHVYPLHALLLQQARAVLKDASPSGLMIGAMRGKPEIMWLLAARERGIPTGAYTLDDSVDPHASFRPDTIYCDDARHRDLALERGMAPEQVVMVQSHRSTQQRTSGPPPLIGGQRARILLADTFFSGWKMAALSSLSLWTYRLVVEAARLLPEHDFIIKFHPLRERPVERLSWGGFHYQQLWQRESFIKQLRPPANVILTAPEQRMSDLFTETHILLNIQSYASFEAYALNVPVIHLAAPENEPEAYARLIRMGAAQVVDAHDPARLAALIRQNLFDPTHIARQTALQKEFLQGFYPGLGVTLAEAAAR